MKHLILFLFIILSGCGSFHDSIVPEGDSLLMDGIEFSQDEELKDPVEPKDPKAPDDFWELFMIP